MQVLVRCHAIDGRKRLRAYVGIAAIDEDKELGLLPFGAPVMKIRRDDYPDASSAGDDVVACAARIGCDARNRERVRRPKLVE